MTNRWLCFAGIFGFLGVATGAFGAHALEGSVSPKMADTFDTASHYCLAHALALLGLASVLREHPDRLLRVAGWCFVGGISVFSGSLWVLVLSGQKWLGAITPIGGTALITGWLCIALRGWRGDVDGE